MDKQLADDLVMKSAKRGSSDRNHKPREEQGQEVDHKRRKFDDIGYAVMNEDDPRRLATLSEEFKKEHEQYLKENAEMYECDAKPNGR